MIEGVLLHMTKDINNVAAGTYSVNVTDDNGCVSIGSVVIREPAALNLLLFTQDILCGDKTGVVDAVVSGGTPPYNYVWSNGASDATNDNIVAGTYSVTVTDPEGCEISDSATITGISGLITTTSTTPDTLNSSGTASVNVVGGTQPYTYTWSDANTQTNATATGLAAGTYTVTVVDANSCVSIDTAVVGTGVGVYDISNEVSLMLYPNPNDGNFVVDFSQPTKEKVVWELFSSVGKVVTGGEAGLGTTKLNFDISSYAQGIYFLRVIDGNSTTVKRVVFTR